MTTIRRMEEADADAVRQVDATAFEAWLKEARGWQDELSWRTRTIVLAAWEHDPKGCFVAEDRGYVVGFIFSRTWGSVGWFGTFGVLPEHQGRGIGQELIAASLDYLRRDPGRVVGLETMPDSPRNLGLYLNRGFHFRFLSLQMTKTLGGVVPNEAALPDWSRAHVAVRQRWLVDLREAADRIWSGLDYTKEIVSTAHHRLGRTLVLTDEGRAVAMSIVRLVSLREGLGDDQAVAQPIALHPARTNTAALSKLLEASEALARAHDKRSVVVPVNSRHAWALGQVLQAGYRVKAASVRMVLSGTDKGPCVDHNVNLSRWAG